MRVATAIFEALQEDDIPKEKLLTLGSDGPNVNKTIWKELESRLEQPTQVLEILLMWELVISM